MPSRSIDKTRRRARSPSTEKVAGQGVISKCEKNPSSSGSLTTDEIPDTQDYYDGNTVVRPRVSPRSPLAVPQPTIDRDESDSEIVKPLVPDRKDLSDTEIGRNYADSQSPPTVGTLIRNRFCLMDKIGQGGMGVVFSARDLRKEEAGDEDSLVAIKLLNADFKRHPQALQMLQQECKRSQGLAHPNIVTVYDFDRDGSTVYMTMQYLRGHTLEQQTSKLGYTGAKLEVVMPVIHAISAGLAYAHKHKIVHSDLKPSNVMVTDSNEIKIFDFGIARAMKAVDTKYNENDLDTDIMGLTPRFASPEMFNNAPPDPRDDVFAFGCIIYLLLSGRHPFGVAANEVSVERQEPKRIRDLSERQWDTLRRSLAFDRKARLESADDFLQGFLPPVKQRWRSIALFLGISVIAISTYFYLRAPEPPSLFTNPLPEAVVSPEIDSQISDMLDLADVHLMVGRAISPPGSNALDQYYQVLELQPYNRAAIEGLRQLLKLLGSEGESAIATGDLERARMIVDVGLSINAEDSDMQRLDEAISE